MSSLTIQEKSYASNIQGNPLANTNLYLSLQVGYGHLSTDKKLVDAGNKFASDNKTTSPKTSSYYGNIRLGVNYKSGIGINFMPYLDYANMQEYDKASPTHMVGVGIELDNPIVLFNKLLRISYGAEFHSNRFDFMKVQNNMISYSGFGYKFNIGLVRSYYSINLFYLHNDYSYEKISTGTPKYDDIINSAFPESVQSSMIGVTFGLAWR